MSQIIDNLRYTNETQPVPAAVQDAMTVAAEFSLEAVSTAVGSQLALLSRVTKATSIVDLDSGIGVSGLWLLHGNPAAQLTSVDTDPQRQHLAREVFSRAGYPANQTRLILGQPLEILPRLNDESYDLVLLNAKLPKFLDLFEHALRITKPGGLVIVSQIFLNGSLANPVNRDQQSQDLRTLIASLSESTNQHWVLTPIDGGLLEIVKN